MASQGPGGPSKPGGPTFELQSNDDQLVQIARAEALLQQRDPEQAALVARAQALHRDTEAERRQRASQIEIAVTNAAKASTRRRVLAAVILALIAAAAVPTARFFLQAKDQEEALRTRLASLGKPAAGLGFRDAGQWLDVPKEGVTLAVPRNTCSALVAAREGDAGPLPLSVERPGAARITENGGVIWCSCEPEKVTITTPEGRGARVTLGWLSAPTPATGGLDVLLAHPAEGFRVAPDPAAVACADAGFQGWAEQAGHGDADPLPATRPGPTADLVADGFEPAGLFPGDRPFAVIRARKGRCYLAAPERGVGDLTLRGPDGSRLTATPTGGALAWCSHAADAVFSLWHGDKNEKPSGPPGGAVAVLGAPADRAGGTLGTWLAARRHGYREVRTAVLPDELSKDAAAALRATSAGATSLQEADATGLSARPDHRVAAFSLRGKIGMLPEVAPSVPTACLPDASFDDGGPGHPLPFQICAQAQGQTWKRSGEPGDQGGASGTMPFWLGVLEGATDEGALRAVASLLLFAQRLTLLGYEATTTEGVKDAQGGATVTGMGGKGVIAVGLSRTRPWVSPLTDGPAWTLSGAPRVVQIPTGQTRVLRSAAPLAADPKDRRVVVWRR